jgi:hypothetical protein
MKHNKKQKNNLVRSNQNRTPQNMLQTAAALVSTPIPVEIPAAVGLQTKTNTLQANAVSAVSLPLLTVDTAPCSSAL